MPVCFSNERERKGMNLGGKGSEEIWEESKEENHNQNILYRKKTIFNKNN